MEQIKMAKNQITDRGKSYDKLMQNLKMKTDV